MIIIFLSLPFPKNELDPSDVSGRRVGEGKVLNGRARLLLLGKTVPPKFTETTIREKNMDG